ncbi:hypothetical protein F7734_32120 [Scytonema sp. UIC 10036]|uniref:hypothetical protein n=1 Tax=Scytonema sp. UIC 10036 TaxID=2304196 RepID=UPI0012DA4651|nr:hypothetical protein [Scytonema sp. UIC 10036]MUG96736.1 hypothetical protein [Scytonema sp. UIC 10036]
MRLKRWESPRREGRNNKGRGGSARQRQLKKQQQMLRKKLKEGELLDNDKRNKKSGEAKGGRETNLLPFFLFTGNAIDVAFCMVYESES